jgi:hypothetical protein
MLNTCERTDRRMDMTKLIGAFRHYANVPENRSLAQEIERRFLGRPFCNLVFIPSSFGSDFHALRNASLHPSASFVDVGRQRHAGLDVQYCVGLYGVCMSVPREGTQSECRIREERSYSGEYHQHSECKYPRIDCKILRNWMQFSSLFFFLILIHNTNGFNP